MRARDARYLWTQIATAARKKKGEKGRTLLPVSRLRLHSGDQTA
jgi:hypothetical protein